MLELALQYKVIDMLDNFAKENGVEPHDVCNFVSAWGNGRLPSPDEAYDALQRGEENFRMGKYTPAKEVVAEMRKVIEPYL